MLRPCGCRLDPCELAGADLRLTIRDRFDQVLHHKLDGVSMIDAGDPAPAHASATDMLLPLSPRLKLINLTGIVLPFLGLAIAVGLLWDRMVGFTELGILAVGYLATGVGVTV